MTPTEFTPLSGLLGGALIGLASAAVALALGRIAGISGIFAGALRPTTADWSWHAPFSLGLVLGAFLTIRSVDGAGWTRPLQRHYRPGGKPGAHVADIQAAAGSRSVRAGLPVLGR